MRKIIRVFFFIILIALGAEKASAQMSPYVIIKTDIRLDLGGDLGLTFKDKFGVKIGMMSDIYHPTGNKNEIITKFEEALGKKYRLSYTGGVMFKIIDWMWLSATGGYGEYGTYGYNSHHDIYGITGKVTGLELGLQFRFTINDLVLIEVGYGTIPKGFTLNKPFHDISLGIGIEI